ncbi:TetR/AcrR family transcriptional regulator [Nocardia sp. NPDC055029]
MPNSERLWGGRTADERQAERRDKLVDAAKDIWVESGWAAVTMRQVCARTKIADRYFWGSFEDREALLAAIWDEERDGVLADLTAMLAESTGDHPVTILRRGVVLVTDRVADDPRRAQILFGDHAGNGVLEHRRHELLHMLTDVFVDAAIPYGRKDIDAKAFRLSAIMFLGGWFEMMVTWQAGAIDASARELIDLTVQHAETLGQLYLRADFVGDRQATRKV